jgi:hypothetical protein
MAWVRKLPRICHSKQMTGNTEKTRIYECVRALLSFESCFYSSLVNAIQSGAEGSVRVGESVFLIERGTLAHATT